METSQEYGSEMNATTEARRMAKAAGVPHYAVETRYGWVAQSTKPSLRSGRVWEMHPNGAKCYG